MFDGGVVKEHNKLRIVSEESHSLQINHWSCIMLFGHQWLAPGVCRLEFSTRIHDAGAPRQLSHSLQSEYCLFICVSLYFTKFTQHIFIASMNLVNLVFTYSLREKITNICGAVC
jgi:hypothetical protein